MKFGSVAIIGRSNVGKSTLLNRLLKEKIAIVSDKPQTTRTRILGVAHVEGAQIVFLDTPGFHEPHHLLNRRMVRTTLDTFDDADVLYVVVEATSQPGPGDLAVIDHVRQAVAKQPRPVVLVINKVDLVNKSRILPLMDQYLRIFPWTELVPVSAETADNVDRLLTVTVSLLEEGEATYSEDVVTDQSMRTLAAELIREKILQQTYEEVPHSVAVEIEEFRRDEEVDQDRRRRAGRKRITKRYSDREARRASQDRGNGGTGRDGTAVWHEGLFEIVGESSGIVARGRRNPRGVRLLITSASSRRILPDFLIRSRWGKMRPASLPSAARRSPTCDWYPSRDFYVAAPSLTWRKCWRACTRRISPMWLIICPL